ncbi:spermine synthase [Mangrovactinospora gilvigrisea]|uniref:Spermine synthase n=1 Tax=Mangrovactinospora gilvigrisea TaxID=1428644 RepID=A0A1J7BBT6_9ACTN|nr:fused MFS/spermidine synthase [Mangrovactinospora gilvigrisea]OIV36094.1 spermine synthase [Mangrovactinospora gilvigrisea]
MPRPRKKSERAPVRETVDTGEAALLPDVDRPRATLLTVDGAPQSYIDLDDPTYLEFEYQRRIGHVIDVIAAPRAPLTAIHLGGGALGLPRYVAATRPRSRQQVAEIDARLTALIRRELPLDRNWQIKVRQDDARALLGKIPDAWADLVTADVFTSTRTPAHLTSREFVEEAARTLAADGVYAANLADGPPLAFARAQAATVAAVFEHVYLVAEPTVLRGRRFGNVVLVGSRRELPAGELSRRVAGDPFPGRLVHGTELKRFVAGAQPVTDATATPSPKPPDDAFGVGGQGRNG